MVMTREDLWWKSYFAAMSGTASKATDPTDADTMVQRAAMVADASIQRHAGELRDNVTARHRLETVLLNLGCPQKYISQGDFDAIEAWAEAQDNDPVGGEV